MSRRSPVAVGPCVMALVLSVGGVLGCGPPGADPGRMELSVFAASSLTEAFRQLEEGFEAAHPDIDVRLTFSGSQVLRLQLEQGAVADVFASANERHMDALVDAGMVSYSRVFAHNELVVVVPPDNPASVDSFPELPRAERLVIGTEGVPVGIYTRQLLDRAGAELGEEFVARLRDSVVSEEANVRLVRAKVELGEADAAIVYRTDATVSDRVKVVAVPESLNVRASYFIGPITASGNPAADRFIAYVLSEEGRRALEDHGFVTGAS